jgi:hypothetical protein
MKNFLFKGPVHGRACVFPNNFSQFQTNTFVFWDIIATTIIITGTRGTVVRWGSMPQAGRSWVRFPLRSMNFSNLRNPSSHNMALGSTQPLTEMSTRNLAGVQGGRRIRSSSSPPSMSWLTRKYWSLKISKPYGSPRPVTGIALHFCNLHHAQRSGHWPFFS